MKIDRISLEQTILRNLLGNEEYTRKVVPFLKSEYFDGAHRKIFHQIGTYIKKYNKLPGKEALKIQIDSADLNDKDYEESLEILPHLFTEDKVDNDWLVDETEKWCKEKALFNAVMESITILDGKHKSLSKEAMPQMFTDALSISFDINVGHDYLGDFSKRFEYYHQEHEHLPFDLDMLNKITGGGLLRKTLNMILAGCVHPDTKVNVRIKGKTS